jgi:A/G-specific adenine glycosylase
MNNQGSQQLKRKFSTILLKWNKAKNNRKMPWKGENDPYRIWLSEIMLQQTRVAQGIKYYNNFIKTFPDIHKLAKASDKKIYKMWEGLGYYSRCRNLIETAHYISKNGKGKFPDTYDEIRALKGIGPYTAAAISSFAFNLPYAVIDGNVFRVLARVFGINKPVDTAEGKKYFQALADKLLDKKHPGLYNQSIMDFGAVVCKPVSPLCTQCDLNKNCYAFLNNKIAVLPVKKKKIIIRKRWFYFLVLECNHEKVIRQRTGKDIWQGLYEFPLIETGSEQEINTILKEAERDKILQKNNYKIISISAVFKQQLSHQFIIGRYIHIRVKKIKIQTGNLQWVKETLFKKYSFPQIINQYLVHKEFR